MSTSDASRLLTLPTHIKLDILRKTTLRAFLKFRQISKQMDAFVVKHGHQFAIKGLDEVELHIDCYKGRIDTSLCFNEEEYVDDSEVVLSQLKGIFLNNLRITLSDTEDYEEGSEFDHLSKLISFLKNLKPSCQQAKFQFFNEDTTLTMASLVNATCYTLDPDYYESPPQNIERILANERLKKAAGLFLSASARSGYEKDTFFDMVKHLEKIHFRFSSMKEADDILLTFLEKMMNNPSAPLQTASFCFKHGAKFRDVFNSAFQIHLIYETQIAYYDRIRSSYYVKTNSEFILITELALADGHYVVMERGARDKSEAINRLVRHLCVGQTQNRKELIHSLALNAHDMLRVNVLQTNYSLDVHMYDFMDFSNL